MISRRQLAGFTLLELIVFIVIVGIALSALVMTIGRGNIDNVRPIYQVRALELAQAQMDAILGRRWDENTPSGGLPSCAASGNCSTTLGPEGESGEAAFDDIDDYNGFSKTVNGYTIAVNVSFAQTTAPSTALPLVANDQTKIITVRVSPPANGIGNEVVLSTYRTNF